MLPAEPNADFLWLQSPEAGRWLEELSRTADATVALAERLRGQLPLSRVHALFEQVNLRKRAREKFSQADRMFFTTVGLQQATDEVVAGYKADRFPSGSEVWDLCCGIGGDLLALARRGPTVGVDRDPVAATCADANLRVITPGGQRHSGSRVVQDDAEQAAVATATAWHIDPDRRPEGKRTTRVALHEPGPKTIERLLALNESGAVKLAPAAVWPEAWNERAEFEWISRDGQCRQLVAWFGSLAHARGRRSATVLSRTGPRTIVGARPAQPAIGTRLGRYVFEPDAAVLAAGLCGALAAEHHLLAVAPKIAYLTGDAPLDDPALAAFEVLDVLPLDTRRLKAWLRQRQIGRLEIKKRGVTHEPEQLRRQLRVPGDEAAVLLLAPLALGVSAILAKRVAPP